MRDLDLEIDLGTDQNARPRPCAEPMLNAPDLGLVPACSIPNWYAETTWTRLSGSRNWGTGDKNVSYVNFRGQVAEQYLMYATVLTLFNV